ncbi:hypothetical protein [Vandammella animalimorsus]|uniref:hypothetical protein n=1 Tax=Vandammella animalimorsus TaxID=2029117 RepID=UPI00117DFDFE|nr:hypothetical protein [Vandammella animalimorsus]
MTCSAPKTTSDAPRACQPTDHLAGIERALQRAYENACRIAWQTNTAMVFEKNGQIVKIHFPEPIPPKFTP